MDQQPPADMELTLRTLAMPADANPAGDIFGGWVMSQMDLAAFVRANDVAGGRTVTVAVNEIVFKKPVKIGDTLCVYTRIEKIGRTSVTLKIEAWTRRHYRDSREKVTEAVFIMVAVDENGEPRPVRKDV
ncbi:acyl-CoA thioesterase [Rhizobium pusense]|jgi:acyl-CoA thioesterase YciA|uniref:Acyl-CoA thioesterase n=3 Tax=Hyphomicrobiales TaxID=356 RepID=A0A1S9E5C6_9HYPH|nr:MULTISPECIES: acyl-CoA thioesterase [Rhizobium/Agrobacterium group]AMD57834.1 acyl-CoA thioesterase [Agrobacterium tumefaciens]ANV26495.1 acyl-CoA thioesterase [Rhizobium sp. S41]AUC12232.1 acyl-CoA thioesterase [Rhizobium sp. Y9]EKJ93963.1 acyl-CoA hydrolase [Bradyrhizobium lupini HPC(L)]KGE83071.1 acyl-CoA hydrolase [Rhizobium sp. H41]KIV65309.1 cytosolic long-chain acyl-CoA thioester hydrolase family protein [Rhizobium sp. UR51a]MBB2908562.1 acyl-CoA thioesterase YciA [Rhizobium sp. RA